MRRTVHSDLVDERNVEFFVPLEAEGRDNDANLLGRKPPPAEMTAYSLRDILAAYEKE